VVAGQPTTCVGSGGEDFDSVAAYRGNVQRLGLLVDACHDWSSHVTAPLGTILDWVSWLASSPWGRWLLIQQNPVLRGLTDEDWEEFVRAAAAHRHVNRYTSYVALVVRRPPPCRGDGPGHGESRAGQAGRQTIRQDPLDAGRHSPPSLIREFPCRPQ
jgi:hypothetical protein